MSAWTKGSNGQVEVRVFALRGARGAHADAPLLRSLGLDSVPASAKDVTVTPAMPEDLLAELFSAGHGGAYNRIAPDAWARDVAWRSLGALVGSPAGARPIEVERETRAAGITRFRSTAFFCEVAWDIAFAAVSPMRDRLAILAATDTD